MPARDVYHHHVCHALIKDGWTITDDPYVLKWGLKDLYVDLGAERFIGAERQGQKIAVEIKSFLSPSEIEDLKDAIGQFFLYLPIIARTEPNRVLFLAIREAVYHDLFEEPIGAVLLEEYAIKLIVFDPQTEEIVKWVT